MSTLFAREFTAQFDLAGKLVLNVQPSAGTLSIPMSVTRPPRRRFQALPTLLMLLGAIIFLVLVIFGLEYSYAVKHAPINGPPVAYHGVPIDYD